MSNNVEVVFGLESTREGHSRRRSEGLPTGIVDSIEVIGYDKSIRRRFGRALRVATELPSPVAANILDFHRRYIAGREGRRYNCLSFMASSQGWYVGGSELFFDTGPDLVEGRFAEFKDIERLEAGAAYGLPDDDSQLIHGIVGLSEVNRHLDVDGRGGEMRYMRTIDTLNDYIGSCVMPNRLVQLEEGGYRSSEVISASPAARASA